MDASRYEGSILYQLYEQEQDSASLQVDVREKKRKKEIRLKEEKQREEQRKLEIQRLTVAAEMAEKAEVKKSISHLSSCPRILTCSNL